MARLLCTCPSRSRPELLKQMIDSFNKTASDGTDMIIYLDEDDPVLPEYNLYGPNVLVLPRRHVAQIHNWIIQTYPHYDYYMPINDDIIFRTKGWDKLLINTIEDKGYGWGISYGNDLGGNYTFNLPTFGMMSANIVKTLGYFYPLELKMMFGDTFLLDLGRAIGRLYYNPDVIIEHRPPGYGAGAFVPGDFRGKTNFYKTEHRAYAEYIDTKLQNDIDKIFNAIINQNSLQAVK